MDGVEFWAESLLEVKLGMSLFLISSPDVGGVRYSCSFYQSAALCSTLSGVTV